MRHRYDLMEQPQARPQEGKRDWFTGLLTSFRHSSKEDILSIPSTPSPDSRRLGRPPVYHSPDGNTKIEDVADRKSWTTIHPSGIRPEARCDHAATVIGRKMIIVGGQAEDRKLNDVHVLHLGKLTWSELGVSPKDVNTPKTSERLPPCKGHSLISWGKTILLVGGDMDQHTEKVTVWSFDLETELWTKVNAKGEIPAARSGQSVTRAGSILVMFGGEDPKGRKINDLHVLDLKSLMWLPLHTIGKGPSPRAKHAAAMYDDRYLLVFGGASKSKVLNDLHALDFESMTWSRLKPGGFGPSPRAGSSGVLVNDKWYICGGAQRGKRVTETISLDIPKMTWVNIGTSSLDSVASNQRSSLVVVQKKDRTFLVVFGGSGIQRTSNEVQVLYVAEQRGSPSDHMLHDNVRTPPCAGLNVAQAYVSPSDQSSSVLSRLLESPSPESVPGLVPLRKIHSQMHHSTEEGHERKIPATLKKDLQSRVGVVDSLQLFTTEYKEDVEVAVEKRIETSHEHVNSPDSESDREESTSTEQMRKMYERKLALALKTNVLTEAQLEDAEKEKEDAERKLNNAIRAQQTAETKLNAALREMEELRHKLEASELIQEESNSLSNIVHSENLRLEHDLSFLKAVLEETQKELHSTRGVLSSERSRAFQLQVELFELKQKLQQ